MLRGALAYRADRFADAVPPLRECLRAHPDWDGKVLAWLWLALAKHRLGHAAEARAALGQAPGWLDRYKSGLPARAEGKVPLHLHDWMEAQLLRREAAGSHRPGAGLARVGDLLALRLSSPALTTRRRP